MVESPRPSFAQRHPQDLQRARTKGNRAADGVTGVSFWFRNDLAESIALSFRVASPQNYPGASAFDGLSIAANTYTLVEFNLLEVRDEWVSFEGNNDATALSNAGNMQIRFVVPASLVGRNINGNFDLS